MKKRTFISFDYDHDHDIKECLVGQARNPDSPFEITDMSIKEPISYICSSKAALAEIVCAAFERCRICLLAAECMPLHLVHKLVLNRCLQSVFKSHRRNEACPRHAD